ncbi:tRNA (adenosine(37)-N6)-threonylcarbamoyltransferase complex dimerization subunit type 1 TsaB [Wolbachia endosymbiont of Howardula sp.]|uniref:tRNA (adenosine(37)-N6)-threonylcarbamoyltransferase complex dimerization subunit type 1 TsaB n=1 Tax=Wolbachia endosymbiont of Howardula sp. TaxID=2916816 RepID=UPI00217DBFFC|nr:tRNA (adenosine(37)-N6)-threonylcarbamoyltransferase complex dimerization subunit type 1 TsaB [Wolbachia endosymbiont of Howardula sp.]UWI83058.1 tRNA (adenosine(37)-N6)-threonylcarbamoyltransferase complex dimerization subunit type 1 TsaB [Wolbachia endosymbiont of Howardula sp.]
MTILAINSIYDNISIAIVNYDGSIFQEESTDKQYHTESFFQILTDLFCKLHCHYDQIEHLVVVVGPGSFTGIRVGMSAAIGMNIATNKPLYGVSAFEVQAYNTSLLYPNNLKNIRVISNTKIRYTQLFNCNLLPISQPTIVVNDAQQVSDENSISVDSNNNIVKNFHACDAGKLVLYRLSHQQQLHAAKAMYLHEPNYNIS